MRYKEFEMELDVVEPKPRSKRQWLAAGKTYTFSGKHEERDLMEILQMGSVYIEELSNVPVVQLTGFCTQQLIGTPIVYATALRIPYPFLMLEPDAMVQVRITHDDAPHVPAVRDRLAPDQGYAPIGMRCKDIMAFGGMPISRSDIERLDLESEPVIRLDAQDMRHELDKRGWLAFGDKVEGYLLSGKKRLKRELLFEPVYVSTLLDAQFKGMQHIYGVSDEFDEQLGKGVMVHPSAYRIADKVDWVKDGRNH